MTLRARTNSQVRPPTAGEGSSPSVDPTPISDPDNNELTPKQIYGDIKVSSKAEKRLPGYVLNTVVRPSTIPGAGLGLFLLETAHKNDRVAKYSGELISKEEAHRRHKNGNCYIMQINKRQALDASKDPQFKGKRINSGGREAWRNNARIRCNGSYQICPTTGRKWVSIKADKTIPPYSEIFMPYGTSWKWQSPQKDNNPAPAMAQVATIEAEQDATSTNTSRQTQPAIQQVIRTCIQRARNLTQHQMTILHTTWNRAVNWSTTNVSQHVRDMAQQLQSLLWIGTKDDTKTTTAENTSCEHSHTRGQSDTHIGQPISTRMTAPDNTEAAQFEIEYIDEGHELKRMQVDHADIDETAASEWDNRNQQNGQQCDTPKCINPQFSMTAGRRHPLFECLPFAEDAISHRGTMRSNITHDVDFVVSQSIGENYITTAACKTHH